MPSGTPRPATPDEVAKFGHIAALMRKYMTDHSLKGPQFAEAMGIKDMKNLAQLYKWLGSKAAPGHMYRKRVAKVLGVEPDFLRPRKPGEVTHLPALTPVKAGDVLQFNINSEGMVRLKFDATLPASKGIPLLKIVLATAELMGDVTLD